jgi:hypothetical protein
MRRSRLVVPVASIVAAAAITAAAGAASHARTVSFVGTAHGNQISATQSAFKYHDSVFGNGAGVQTTKLNGAAGTDKTTVYYGNGTSKATDSFTIGTPDANGIATITGTGQDIGGTGRSRGVRSHYTITGTFDSKNGMFQVTLRGKYTIPR